MDYKGITWGTLVAHLVMCASLVPGLSSCHIGTDSIVAHSTVSVK